MNLFNYLMAKKGHNTSVRDDLFAYLLGKKTSREVKTASGTTISISDVTSTKIVSLTLSKESTQDGTPTPENPQEVKNVKGNTNIFNPNQNFERGQYANGTWENNNARVTTEFFPTKTGDKWNIFVDLDDSQNVELINYNLFDENYTWLGARTENGDSVIAGKKIHSFQINIQNVAYMRISFRSSLGAYVELPIANVQNSKAQLTNGWEQMPYIPYGTNNYIKVNISNGTDSIEKYIFLNNNEIVGKGINLDELIIDKHGHCFINKKFAKIDSYNGETITTDYWSTTGGLDIGATIYYVLSEPQLIDLNYTVDMTLFKGINNISNSEDMDMTLKYY